MTSQSLQKTLFSATMIQDNFKKGGRVPYCRSWLGYKNDKYPLDTVYEARRVVEGSDWWSYHPSYQGLLMATRNPAKNPTTVWMGAKPLNNYRSLNWWVYRISGCNQQYQQYILGKLTYLFLPSFREWEPLMLQDGVLLVLRNDFPLPLLWGKSTGRSFRL